MHAQKQVDELLKEQSLWQAYRRSPWIFETRFNRYALLLSGSLFVAFAVLSYYSRTAQSVRLPPINLLEVLSKWAEVGISFSATILGFLLAGFSVLLSLIRPATAVALLRLPWRGMSSLKFILLLFVDVFVHYLSFLCWCFGFFMVSGKGGILDSIHLALASRMPLIAAGTGYLVFVVWGIWQSLILLKLKSFVWNLYQVLLVVMSDAIEAEDDRSGHDHPGS